MSHLILHIGTHKTGTTAIQDTFWTHAAKLRKVGLIYPRLPYRQTGHHGLIADQVGLPEAFHLPGGGWRGLQHLADAYAEQGVTLFLSSEEFSRAESKRSVNFAKIRQTFHAFDRVTVLCFLRPQWRFLQSIYLEISKNRSPPRPPELVAEALKTGRCQGLYLDYGALLDRLAVDFTPDEVCLVDYESTRNTHGGAVSAALSEVGVGDVLAKTNEQVNPSPPALPQWAANLLAEPYAAAPSQVLRIGKTLPSNGCLLTRAEVAQLRAHFEPLNAELIARRSKIQPDFTITDPTTPPDMMYREDVSLEHWLSIARSFANAT